MFSSIKNALFESDDKAKPVAPQVAVQPVNPFRPAGGPAAPIPQAVPQLNQAMVDAIRKGTFGRNTALTTLITASEQLADIIPDPVTRLKAAHRTAGGRDSNQIVEAVNIHLNDINAEEARFKQALEQKSKTELGELHRTKSMNEGVITNKTQAIERLQAELQASHQALQEAQVKVGEIDNLINEKQHELANAENEFKIAANAVRAELEGHRNSILSTLGN
jgi:hypothetical protein